MFRYVFQPATQFLPATYFVDSVLREFTDTLDRMWSYLPRAVSTPRARLLRHVDGSCKSDSERDSDDETTPDLFDGITDFQAAERADELESGSSSI